MNADPHLPSRHEERVDVPPPGMLRTILPGALTVLVVFVGVAATSTYALLTLLLDGFAALAVLLPASLAGLWYVPCLRLGRLPLRWHLLLGATFGVGSLALLVLLLGWLGVLARPVWMGLLAIAFVAGALRLHQVVHACRDAAGTRSAPEPLRWLAPVVSPFLILAVLAAVHAPGFLWSEEGWGYDALEYHLALPKEYLQDGQISYTPHNVYGNFPANVEMLYLAAMVVLDEDREAGTTAHMIHLALAALTAFAAYVAGCEWSHRTGILAAIMIGTCGWPVYLSGLAFVEHGLLFFGMTAVAAIVRGLLHRSANGNQPGQDDGHASVVRWYAVAGAAAGLACGCKYTAVPMIAMPVAIAALLAPRPWSRRMGVLLATLTACLITFSPWLIKNLAMTGNPVFPLANRWFEATPPGWGMAESAHWDRCHTVASETNADPTGQAGRFARLWTRVLSDQYGRFGPLLFVLAVVGGCIRRPDRATQAVLIVLLLQILVWMIATHQYARFAVVLLIPLSLLAGRATRLAPSGLGAGALAGATIVGASVNFWALLTLYRTEAVPGATAPASVLYGGAIPGYDHLAVVNHQTPSDARILVIGDARAYYYDRAISYHVVFNRNPFVDAVRENSSPGAVAQWLRDEAYTHILVHHQEISRLRRSSYGFPKEVTAALFSELEQAGFLNRLSTAGSSAIVLYEVK